MFLEYQDTSLYSYRIHNNHLSSIRKEIHRLRLISWLKNLKINRTYKYLLMIGAKLQYLILYKQTYGSLRVNRILFKLRNKIIRFRSGA